MAANQALNQMVQMNESIKLVVNIAFRINLMALNAILLSRRAGDLARGFGVISQELCSLSVALSENMRQVSAHAFHSVAHLSVGLRRQHRMDLFVRTHQQQTDARIDAVLQEGADFLSRSHEAAAHEEAQLHHLLEDAEQLCLFGIALSRSAKIEAAYGASYSSALREIAQEFDDYIQAILPELVQLRRNQAR
ncbi:hypothetical protein [Chitinilyticum piscinae]|uniref:Methyl-accepting transducer domain-containing protein n=1 Tax=Chitinilyticum piscinae TaxID=2866724 RepID=A0A8J7K1M1_9NEIS|nr:hypothetical protein [Chitinilyticum piscinae]MBE9609416.1 hypothetical protein [Chitinilyticum piscinae]